MPLELLLKDARQIALESYTDRPVDAGEIRARAVLSAISHGTEISLYRGISPFHDRQYSTSEQRCRLCLFSIRRCTPLCSG